LMLGANRNFRVAPEGPPEVQELARAANDLAQQRDALLTDVEQRITLAKTAVEAEKNRLAALMSQLAQGVVVCNLDGRILLYNSRARLQFKALSQGPTSLLSGALIGLGRSIHSILEQEQVTHALDTIQRRMAKGDSEPVASFITASRSGQLLRTQMAPVLAAAEIDSAAAPVIQGYVLTVENITRGFEREAQRDQVLHTLTDGGRAALGNARAAAETLLDDPEMDSAMRQRLLQVVADETAAMSQRLEQTMSEFADSLKTRWPLEDVLGMDIVAAAQRRIEAQLSLLTKTETMDEKLWVRADSLSLIQAIAYLAARLQENYGIRELRFRLGGEGKMAYLDLIWSGVPVSAEALYTWELEPMNTGAAATPLNLRDVISRHGGEVWLQREGAAQRAFFRIVLPVAAPPENQLAAPMPSPQEGRPEYYDFNLFNFRDSGMDLDRPLAELSYSVFDTETTGLQPSAGDEIIQIGAVRILNGRLLRQEAFDQLVDPGVPIKPEGIPIHGIGDDRVRGQPTIDLVLPAFQEFCADTVLVAHNAAFDMRFLQLKEEATGTRFNQPVLDTLLLSAVIHPGQESHQLDAIAERLGIPVKGRHSALGDAITTGEVFLKLLPLLADQGILTLRQALAAAEQTYYARIKY
ncbi:MAG: DNA polymerase III subunit epsilon, partial [Rhodocyclaceae bacterium]